MERRIRGRVKRARRVGLYPGKVSVHTPIIDGFDKVDRELNGWAADPGCTAGSKDDRLAYCQTLWPKTTRATLPIPTDAVLKPFFTESCAAPDWNTGRTTYSCCQ